MKIVKTFLHWPRGSSRPAPKVATYNYAFCDFWRVGWLMPGNQTRVVSRRGAWKTLIVFVKKLTSQNEPNTILNTPIATFPFFAEWIILSVFCPNWSSLIDISKWTFSILTEVSSSNSFNMSSVVSNSIYLAAKT